MRNYRQWEKIKLDNKQSLAEYIRKHSSSDSSTNTPTQSASSAPLQPTTAQAGPIDAPTDIIDITGWVSTKVKPRDL